ncbi:unnamed protein product, partial [Mesorhabditis belari]|uniref:GATOR2 complex protein WDR24 n=1 Tax=Mesorhabditis belari TaxID=2138241 RepID=A0AAF3EB17_9BILA
MKFREEFDNFNGEPKSPVVKEFKRIVEVTQLEPLDAISSNREYNRIVVGGVRASLRIFQVSPNVDGLENEFCFRLGKKRNLLSASHVAWSKTRDQCIGTTSTNGAVTLWNAERGEIEYSFQAHKRTATVVRFHPTDVNLLISGSKDASVYLYDLREKNQVTCFSVGSFETIRDASFHKYPECSTLFVTADDSGMIRIWDIREPKKPYLHFPAHQGYAASISLHSKAPHLLATGGGRDRFIKVWNWKSMLDENKDTRPMYTVETMAPIGRIYWRPGCEYQISSCAIVNDTSVHVWDVRRPFLPIYSFEEHIDSCTDMCWRNAVEQNTFVSCGKDGRVVLHTMREAARPHDFANDCTVDVAPDGLYALGVSSGVVDAQMSDVIDWYKRDSNRRQNEPIVKDLSEHPFDASFELPASDKRAYLGPYLFKNNNYLPHHEGGYCPFSSLIPSEIRLGVPELQSGQEIQKFFKCANGYRLGGASITELCANNARVSERMGIPQVAQTWRLVEALAEQAQIEKRRIEKEMETQKEYTEQFRMQILSLIQQERLRCLHAIPESLAKCRLAGWIFEKDRQIAEQWRADCPSSASIFPTASPFAISAITATSDFYFGDGELEGCLHTSCQRAQLCSARFPEVLPFRSDWRPLKVEAFTQRDPMEVSPSASKPLPKIAEVLQYHADLGDVQTCSCVALVIGGLLGEAIDEDTAATWFSNYLEMLDRLELFVAMAAVRKYAWVKRISDKVLTGTHLNVSCLKCRKRMVDGACLRCDRRVAECVICDLMIFGMHWMCGKCRHPMHLDEAVEWFEVSSMCPVSGCKCQCNLRTTEQKVMPSRPQPQLFFSKKIEIRRDSRASDSNGYRQRGSAVNAASWNLARVRQRRGSSRSNNRLQEQVLKEEENSEYLLIDTQAQKKIAQEGLGTADEFNLVVFHFAEERHKKAYPRWASWRRTFT